MNGRRGRRTRTGAGLVAAAFAGAVVLPALGLGGAGLGGTAAALDAAHPAAARLAPVHTAGMTGMTGMAGMTPAAMAAMPTTATCPVPSHSPVLSAFTQALPVPPRIDARNGGTTALAMRSGTHRFHSDLAATPAFGYTAAADTGTDVYGGPTIEARKGTPVHLAVTNALGAHPLAAFMDPTFMGMTGTDDVAPRGVVHLHGAHSEPSQDGLPDATAGPGNTLRYTYGNDQDSAGLWYHDHSWGMTRLQVSAGLAGQYWLRDAYDTGRPGNALGLPSGAYELPLTLQDRSFNADGTFAYPVGAFCGTGHGGGYPDQWSPESFGDVATVNGAVTPNLDVARGVYRFRVLNGSNARFYHLSMPAGAPVYQIGTDGGLLDAPVRLTSLRLAPAERADLLVDFRGVAPGTTLRITNDAVAPYPSAPPDEADGGSPLPDIMQFRVTTALGTQAAPPATLRGGKGQPARLPALTATRTRTVMLNEIADPVVDEPVHGHINNQFYADATGMPRTTQIETPALDTVEEWDIVNTTGDAHPIHLHLTQVRLLNRQDFDEPAYTASVNALLPAPGLPDPSVSGTGPFPARSAAAFLTGPRVGPAANERGWKDTIVAMPGQVTRILVPFGGTAAGVPAPFVGDARGASVQRFVGTYVFHCHILEHEDNDMMQPYRVHQ